MEISGILTTLGDFRWLSFGTTN